MAAKASEENLTVREMEQLARETKKEPTKRGASQKFYPDLEKQLKEKFGTKVKFTGQSKGKLEIHYYTEEDLIRIIDIIEKL